MDTYAVSTKSIPQPSGKPVDSAISNHARTLANACELAANNLERLKRFKARLCGVHELVGAAGTEQAQPQPDGLLSRLNLHDEDMGRTLNQTAKLLDELDGIA